MKCKQCDYKAVINMRQHKLALCSSHFLDWLPEMTQKIIKKYAMFTEDDKVLVAVSGGKDSLALWDILDRLGYQTAGVYIGLGIDDGIGYSAESERCAQAFADDRELNLIKFDVNQTYGLSIPNASRYTSRGREKPCSLCGLTRRNIMNRIARESGFDVLATGHNLDDEAAVLFANVMNWESKYLRKQNPVLQASDGFVRKVKPFCRVYERESAAYAFLRGIPYVYEECPHSDGAKSIYYKELLNDMEFERPGAKQSFYLSFLRAHKQGLFAPYDPLFEGELHPCQKCGQPTSAPERCANCRTWETIQLRASEQQK
jgi:tRNA-5-methyluridine54 2-sulfurtransferase